MGALKTIPLEQKHQELIIESARRHAEPFIEMMKKIALESNVSLSQNEKGELKIVFSYETDPYYILAKQRVESIFKQCQVQINNGR